MNRALNTIVASGLSRVSANRTLYVSRASSLPARAYCSTATEDEIEVAARVQDSAVSTMAP